MPVSCAHPPGLPTDVFACPTLYTQPHFYKSSPEVVASSGGVWMGWLDGRNAALAGWRLHAAVAA